MSNIYQNIQLDRIATAIENGQAGGELTIDVTGAGDMQPATATTAGVHGLVPAPQAGDEHKFLTGAGTFESPQGFGYSEAVLWEDANGQVFYPSSAYNATLSQGLSNFNIVAFDYTINNDTEYHANVMVPVSMIDKTGTNLCSVVNIGSNPYNCPSVRYVDDTRLTFYGYSSNNPIILWKVVGIKFGL